MSLQNALIFLGIIVVIGIYFMSSRHEKSRPLLDGRKSEGDGSQRHGSQQGLKHRRGNGRGLPGEHDFLSEDFDATDKDHGGLSAYRGSVTRRVIGSADGELSMPMTPPLAENNRIQSREGVMDGWNPVNENTQPIGNRKGNRDTSFPKDPFGDHKLYEDETYRSDVALSTIVREKDSGNSAMDTQDDTSTDLSTEFNSEEIISEFGYRAPEGFEKISQIDYWVKISGERDVGRESVLGIYRDSISSVTKKSNIYGLRLPDKVWCDLELESEEARFGDLVVTVQLADRFGPISESEMTRFSVLVSNLSEKTGRGFSFMAPIESAMEQANAIDSFVRYFDSVFIVNIKPKESAVFNGSVIKRCATQIGLEKSRQNYYVRNKPVGRRNVCLYSLANMSDTGEFNFDEIDQQTIHGVTFFIKPPQIQSPGPVFAEMVDTAKAFASRVKGEVTTPGREDLSTEVVDVIRASIEDIAFQMGQAGIQPGSDEAIKIF